MKIFTIIVLYNCELKNSKTLNSISLALKNNDLEISFLIWDNGIYDQSHLIDKNYEYIHSKINVGISKAYNYAFESALNRKYEWLLLFDQDSIIPKTFFLDLNNELKSLIQKNDISAIVPRIHYNNNYFSPSKVSIGGIHRPIEKSHLGIYKKEIFAINSGSLINLNFLKEINGFNNQFWLDSLDRWLYMKVYEKGGKVYVSNSIIEHDLSILDYNNSVSINRYKNILDYEIFFILKYTNAFDIIFFKFRLLVRVFKFLILNQNLKFAGLTFKKLTSIVFKNKEKFIKNFIISNSYA